MKNLKDREIIMFGASGGLKVAMDSLKKERLDQKVLFCCDNNQKLHGLTTEYNQSIKDPKDILEYENAVIIITCGYYNKIYTQLRDMGAKNDIIVTAFFTPVVDSKQMKTYTKEHFEEIIKFYEIEDDYTSGLLQLILLQRIEPKAFLSYEEVGCYEQVQEYFYDKTISSSEDITYYDAGAYDGQSIDDMFKLYGERIKKIWAFEPESNSFEVLKRYAEHRIFEKVPIECVKAGLSNKDETLRFCGETIGARVDKNGNNEISVLALDNRVHEVDGDLLIKMDIEGSELAALKGACNTIKRYKPYLAICVYHKTKDILEIPQYLRSILPSYKFYLRGGIHTVLYAVPQ